MRALNFSLLAAFALATSAVAAVDTTLASHPAFPQTSCLSELVAKQNAQTNKSYLALGGAGVRPANRSYFIPGRTSKVVVMFHGFMATPDEMVALAWRMHRRTGDAIYAPLIFGFGDNEKVANQTTLKQWQASVKESMTFASRCYSRTDVLGYSMGAGLLTDFLLHESEVENSSTFNGSRIEHVALFSPYWLMHPLGLLAEVLVANELPHHESIPFRDLKNAVDAESMKMLMPNFRDDEMIPLRAIDTLLKMKRLFLLDNPGTAVLRIPAFIIYSEDDPLIDTRFIPIFAGQHFQRVQYKVYPDGSGVRHGTLQRAS